MKKMTWFLTFTVMGMILLSACAPQLGQGGSNPSVTPAVTGTSGSPEVTQEPPTGSTVEPTPGPEQIVTLDDQGKTIYLKVGEGFLLKLGENYDWTVTISDQNVVSRVMNIAVIRGAQGVYDAHQTGTVTLSATGDPQCLLSQPACAQPSIQFEITIVVQ
jgi:ABC-type Fe3+-hydroxamate transport system substrate-binding protein